ncbi:unnamed protein product [Ectocarpus sp. CCAP 1310/34]|nr:unnamed protein product [Ectocarpus sp. CCAP 1310/34]
MAGTRGVMTDTLASRNLSRLGSAALGVVNNTSQRARRENAGAKGRIPSQREYLRAIAAECTWPKVFGTPEGVVPTVARPGKGQEMYDPKATMILTPELRKTFVALWVEGDGNCFWRSMAKALWGTDEYWRQLKLAVLAWSAVNVEALVGEGGALFGRAGIIHYDDEIHAKHIYRGPDGKVDHRLDDDASMLLESIAKFSANRQWGGCLAGVLFTERTGLVLKMPHPFDMRARIRADTSGAAAKATASYGGGSEDEFGDHRYSFTKVPTAGRKEIILRGVSDEEDIVVEEIAITMASYDSAVVGDGSLSDIPVIEADTNLNHLNHFAAIVCADPDVHVRRPFPMSKAGPPLHAKFDKSDAERRAKEEAEWAERQARRAAQRAVERAEAEAEAEAAAKAGAKAKEKAEAEAAAAKRKRDGGGGSGKQLGTDGGNKEKEQDNGDEDGVDEATKKQEEAAAKQLPVYEESVLAAELDAKKKATRYHELKEALSQARQRSDANKENKQLVWFCLAAEEELGKGRVSAAKARRAYEKALRNRNRALRALGKITLRTGVSSVLPSGVGEDDVMESDSRSEDSEDTMARGWNSDDEFFSAAEARKTRTAAKEEEDRRLRAMIERKVLACSELAAATTGAKAAAKRAKNAYKRLVDMLMTWLWTAAVRRRRVRHGHQARKFGVADWRPLEGGGSTSRPSTSRQPQNESCRRLSTKAPSLGRQHIDDHVLKTAEHVFRQLTDVGASTYAVNEMVAEMRASAAYDTAVLTDKQADDAACHDCLDGLAERGGRTEGYCADVPAEAFEGSHDPDITMYGTTSLPSFAELVRNVGIEAVVQVQYKYPRTARRGKVSHIVVVGPKGFQLCTCLKLMRCGLPCSHVFAALVTRLDRASDFIGASIHPRWRKSVVEWSLRNVALGTFDGHETFTGGFTEDFGGGDFDGDSQDTLNTSVAYTRKKAYVDYIAMAQQWANQAAATLDGTPAAYQAYCAMVERQRHEVQALLRGPGPSDGLAGLGNPPIALPNDRKETRHKDAAGTEGGRPKKKSKVEKVVALIQSGKM